MKRIERYKTIRYQKGFTLMELLVVIAIIALLMSIMMPSLSKVKELSRRTICAAQFRQIATIQALYANNFNSWIPRYTDRANIDKPNHVPGVRVWPGTMLAEPFEYCRQSFQMDDKIWVCPGFVGHNKNAIAWEPGKEGQRLKRSTTGPTDQWPSGYWTLGCISLVGITPAANTAPDIGVPESALRVSDPSYYLLAGDKNFRAKYDWSYTTSNPGETPPTVIAHPKQGLPSGANLAHVDGSVSWSSASEIALDRTTMRNSKPEVVPVDDKNAQGKYNTWTPDGREYFF